jgi:hypothetical protein
MEANLPDDLLPEEGSPKTFREYSEWQRTEKSLALYLTHFCQQLRRQISLLTIFLAVYRPSSSLQSKSESSNLQLTYFSYINSYNTTICFIFARQCQRLWMHKYRQLSSSFSLALTLKLIMWRICWASNNASRGQMGFSSAFNGVN